MTTYLLNEDGTYLLNEDGSKLLLEQYPIAFTRTLIFVGGINKVIMKVFARSLFTVGEISKKISKVFVGTLIVGGVIIKLFKMVIMGTLTMSGSIIRKVSKVVTGTLSFLGTLIDKFATILGYKRAIIADTRQVYPLVTIYFASDIIQVYDCSVIESMTLLEESFAESNTPLGAVSSNELTLSLLNTNQQFTPTNVTSPYYGKLLPNLRVDASVGVLTDEGGIAYIDLGTFYTTDWVAPTGSIMASIVCNDRLFNAFNKPMPQIPIQENVNVSSMFSTLFSKMGFLASDIDIDNISYGLTLGWWHEGGTIRDGLQALSEYGLCNVFVGRDDKIRVLRNNNTEFTTFIWTDSDMIINMELPQEYQKIFSEVTVVYHLPFVDVPSSVLTMENVTIPVGGIIINNISFSDIIGAVENVKLIGAINSTIDSLTIGATSISITLGNSSVDEVVNIEVIGRPITIIDVKYNKIDTAAQAIVGNIKFEFNSEYMQSKKDAVIYVDKILPLVANPSAYVSIESRGDPLLQLTNSLLVNNVFDNILGLEVIPIRAQYDFSSGISCTINAIKKEVRDLM